ncbi:MAG TPA: hypothetical protein VIL85_24445 [Thermomicrobiales bacterium]|jgi:hypothetical protein
MATRDYELWDLTVGNLMGVYPSQEAALAEVRGGVRDDGAAAWRDVGLRVAADSPEESRQIAIGDGLIELALSGLEEHDETSQHLAMHG